MLATCPLYATELILQKEKQKHHNRTKQMGQSTAGVALEVDVLVYLSHLPVKAHLIKASSLALNYLKVVDSVRGRS